MPLEANVALADLAGQASEQLEHFAAQMRHGLLAASVSIGPEVMGDLMDAAVAELAGQTGKHHPDRTAYRHGTDDGKVTLGGRGLPVTRLQVRCRRNPAPARTPRGRGASNDSKSWLAGFRSH